MITKFDIDTSFLNRVKVDVSAEFKGAAESIKFRDYVLAFDREDAAVEVRFRVGQEVRIKKGRNRLDTRRYEGAIDGMKGKEGKIVGIDFIDTERYMVRVHLGCEYMTNTVYPEEMEAI